VVDDGRLDGSILGGQRLGQMLVEGVDLAWAKALRLQLIDEIAQLPRREIDKPAG